MRNEKGPLVPVSPVHNSAVENFILRIRIIIKEDVFTYVFTYQEGVEVHHEDTNFHDSTLPRNCVFY